MCSIKHSSTTPIPSVRHLFQPLVSLLKDPVLFIWIIAFRGCSPVFLISKLVLILWFCSLNLGPIVGLASFCVCFDFNQCQLCFLRELTIRHYNTSNDHYVLGIHVKGWMYSAFIHSIFLWPEHCPKQVTYLENVVFCFHKLTLKIVCVRLCNWFWRKIWGTDRQSW